MTINTWDIDTKHSGVNFSVRHMVFAKVRGVFRAWRGTLHLDPNDLTRSKVEVDIDTASIDTGVTERDQHLRSAGFLDVENFPTMRFASRQVTRSPDGRLRVSGSLTLHGVTRDVDLDAEYHGEVVGPGGHRRAAFTASASIDRKEFGLAWNQLLESGGVVVGERVDIELEIAAVERSDAKAA